MPYRTHGKPGAQVSDIATKIQGDQNDLSLVSVAENERGRGATYLDCHSHVDYNVNIVLLLTH
jgi:hypothetical protein